MIDMSCKINGATVRFTGNPQLGRNIKEEMDKGSIVIVSTREERYEMYDTVDVTTPYGVVEQYLVQGDSKVQLNATEYEHTLTLFENLARFAVLYPADRSFKAIGQTLEEILTVYKREFAEFHNIDITWTAIPQAVLDETIPYKEFAGVNFAQILLSLFRKIWAVPKVTRDGTTWDIYPLYHNAKNNLISKDSITKLSQQNNVDYATKVKTQLKNSVNEETVGEITSFPSESGYVLPRSSSLVKITSNLRYELDSDIIAILKAEVVGVEYRIYDDETSTWTDYTNQTIDITSQVVQDEIWDTLKVTTSTNFNTIIASNNVKNNIQYTVGDRYVKQLFGASSDGLIFTDDTEYLILAIARAIYVLEDLSGVTWQLVTPSISASGATALIGMRFKYVRERNIDLVHNRKTKGAMNQSTAIHTQRDSSVEINEYKKNMKLYANRMGNTQNSKTKIFNYPDEPYEIFDYTDDKTIVTNVLYTYHNSFVYCEYEENENFSNIEAEYALMKRNDPYSITAKSVTTNLIVEEFVEFSTTQRDLNTRFTSDARRLLLGLFETTAIGLNKVSVGVFKPVLTSWNSSYAIHMPVEASGDGNLITVHTQFLHQNIAGKTYYDLDTDTIESYLNPLPYTDEDGRLEDYQLYFTPSVVFEDDGEYPLILSETNYLANKYTESGVDYPLDLDSASSFAETLQVSFIADDNIFIGNAMAKKNYFIKDQNTTSSLYIYSSTKPYGEYDQSVRDDDTDITSLVTFSYSFANRTITVQPSIAIDHFAIVKDDNILLAVNQSLSATEAYVIYVNHLKKPVTILNSVANLESEIQFIDEMIVVQFVRPVIDLVGIINMNDEIIVVQQLEIELSLNSSITMLDTISIVQSTNYEISLSDNFALTSSISVIQAQKTVYSITLNDSLSLTSSISATQVGLLYTVNFYDYDDSLLSTQEIESGEDATAPSNPSRTGYTFTGWDTSYYNITADTNIYAEYTIKTYTVTFVANGSTVSTQYVTYGSSATAPSDPTKATDSTYDYTFDSWSGTYTNVTSSRTITAVFTASYRTDVEWAETSSTTVTTNQCVNSLDVGNIKSEVSVTYEFVDDPSYQSDTDLTPPDIVIPMPDSYTTCDYIPVLDKWACTDHIKTRVETTTYYVCQLED